MISCDKASVIVSKLEYNEASISEKLKLKLHLLFCSSCAVISKKNKQLTSLIGKARLYILTDSEKEVLKQKIKELL